MAELNIEVAFALPETQTLLVIKVPEGATVADAIAQSGIKSRFPDQDWANIKPGIWSRVVPETQPLRDGDRIELYRPLIADPKEARRARANNSK